MRYFTFCTFILPLLVFACEPPKGSDGDGDGYDQTVDCNDADPSVYPGSEEICDGVDNDCNGSVDERSDVHSDLGVAAFYLDGDSDGYGDPLRGTFSYCDALANYGLYVQDGQDCDDLDAAIHPDADEVCDEIDNDCDGIVDVFYTDGTPVWYADTDADGHGDPDVPLMDCVDLHSYVDNNDDCDDNNNLIHPDAEEADGVDGVDGLPSCEDDVDNNCDGLVDSRAPECAGSETTEEDTGDTGLPE